MGRSTGKRTRLVKKRKVKLAKGNATASAQAGKNRAGGKTSLKDAEKQRSALLKRHAKEKVVLKHHLRELEDRRAKIVRGQNARMERRELGKYIRQLRQEQLTKHERELSEAETSVNKIKGVKKPKKFKLPGADDDGDDDGWVDVGTDDEDDEAEGSGSDAAGSEDDASADDDDDDAAAVPSLGAAKAMFAKSK